MVHVSLTALFFCNVLVSKACAFPDLAVETSMVVETFLEPSKYQVFLWGAGVCFQCRHIVDAIKVGVVNVMRWLQHDFYLGNLWSVFPVRH